MRLETLRLRGFGPFVDEVLVDVAALPGPLVAVTGDNGAGKSTLLELLPGALYRACPTRGALAALATTRDAFVEARIVNGARYTVRQLVDAVSGKGEAIVLDEGGRALLDSTKLRAFDGWASAHLPPADVLFASLFAVQGRGGFLDASPGQRKAILLRALGIERLEALAAAARERVRRVEGELAVVQARIFDVEGEAQAREPERGADVEAATAELDHAEQAHSAALAERDRACGAFDEARARHAALALERQRAEQFAAERGRLASEIHDLDLEIEGLELRAAELDDQQRQVEELERKLALRAERAAALEQLRAAYAERKAAFEVAKAGLEELAEAASRAEASLRELRIRGQRLEAQTADLAACRTADNEAQIARAMIAEEEAVLAEAQAELEALRRLQLSGARDRIAGLRSGLEEIVGYDGHGEYGAGDLGSGIAIARETLSRDDVAREAEAQAPDRIGHLEAIERKCLAELRDARQALERAQRLAARRPDVEAAAEELERVYEAMRASTLSEAGEAARAARERVRELAGDVAKLVDDGRTIAREVASFDDLATQLVRASGARVRLEEARAARARAVEQLEKRRAELAALPEASVPEAVDLEALAAAAGAAVEALEVARRRQDEAGRWLEDARRLAARIAELQRELAELESTRRDWQKLALDLGRDGLQALEIDAAGPELTSTINELLHSCVSSRWSISIETTRPSADGRKQLEGLDVRVLDTVAGRDDLVETFSGGERVLLGEAVSLGLAMLAAKRAGLEGVTLVRDESGAALDAAHARAYVAMLRRAAELVRASHVLLVTHSAEVAELCDARLQVSGGRVEVL